VAAGYALACQTVVEGDAVVRLPEPQTIERRLVTDKSARAVDLPFAYDPGRDQTVRAFFVTLDAPTLDDATDDLSRLERALAPSGVRELDVPLPLLRELGQRLREAGWRVTALVETDDWRRPDGPPRLIDVLPGDQRQSVWGAAIDIGTTTVSAYLVNLVTGRAVDGAAEYNGQIARGEDVISRILYAGKNGGLGELGQLARRTISDVLARLAQRNHVALHQIVKATVTGNSTMIHLFLGLPPASIRLSPYVTVVNNPRPVLASEIGLDIHPLASVDCLPGIASYVGADITAGVLSSSLSEAEGLTLFIDVGTNGEIALSTGDRTVATSSPAGPAFEGAQIRCGMRATDGAIETVVMDDDVRIQVIGGDLPAKGLCGSGLIDAAAQLRIAGLLDASGRLASADEAGGHPLAGRLIEVDGIRALRLTDDVVLTQHDIRELQSAKAAVATGIAALMEGTGVRTEELEEVLLAGSFGTFINPESARVIGLVPPVPVQRIAAAGNAAGEGAKMALLSFRERQVAFELPDRVEYVELSARPGFNEEFVAATAFPELETVS